MTDPSASTLPSNGLTISEEELRSALAEANVNILRTILYHQTKDPELAAMPVEQRAVRGGALRSYVIPRACHEVIRQKAFEFLTSGAESLGAPSKVEVAQLMALYTGDDPTPTELDYGYEELSYEDVPRNTTWSSAVPEDVLRDFRVTIIGTGFSGIAAAVQLDRLGIKYDMIERHACVGGTWEINDYPEARVDIPSYLYQYKFEKNYPWKSYFAPRDELKEYAEFIVDKYKIRPKISFETTLNSATWDEKKKMWVLECTLADGRTETRESNAVISASGLFSTPKIPDIPGVENFSGRMFHTTEWDHSYDYRGKKVVLIGTGSTGSQLARGVALEAQKLTVFQRTANWVTPIKGYHDYVSSGMHWLFANMPGYLNWFIYTNYIAELQMQEFQMLDPEWVANGGKVNEKNQKLRESLTAYIRAMVPDDELFEKLIPDHSPLARRLVIDNEWYQTLNRDNVDLVTTGIREITSEGVIDNDGVLHEANLLVMAGGFKVSQYLWPARYEGRDGATIEDLWAKDGARAYKSMTMPGFPNFFMMYGPNGGGRIGSFHSTVENLARYICGLMVDMIEQEGSSIEVSRQAFDEYNRDMDAAMSTLLWESEEGGGGYYVNEHGRSGTNMPWTLHQFFEMVKEPDTSRYLVR